MKTYASILLAMRSQTEEEEMDAPTNTVPDKLSTWELFLGEIIRNIKPSKSEIQGQLQFLVDQKICGMERLGALVDVRYMAAYEQAINEYLHPPSDFKQANIKAELIHFGSLFEGLLEAFLVSLFDSNQITDQQYKDWFKNTKNDVITKNGCLVKKYKNGRTENFSFKMSIDCFKAWGNSMKESGADNSQYISLMNTLREQRNNVHINLMVASGGLHDEYKLVEVRAKFDGFVELVKRNVLAI